MHSPDSTTQPNPELTRRHFVGLTSAATAGILLNAHRPLLEAAEAASSARSNVLKGFIVSDSHFGWKNPEQPAVEEQRQAMAHLMKRFPDLDVFIDTGDAHHNYATAEDRGHWTDVIPGGCGTLPFYFLAGNHDVTAWSYPWSPEQDIMRVASIGCRPYFSFDLKNIHFLAIPELMNMCSVTDEVLEWARLDLELNRDKTIIVLSHNALLGTTEPSRDNTYRVVLNSDDVYKLLDSAPNVVAWMHGHNHDYNLVPKNGRLYISNGRFGGFVPKDSTNSASNNLHAPLGGMYFEVHPDKFLVRSYSVPDAKFLDEKPGGEKLTQSLSRPTGLKPDAAPVYSFGAGLMAPAARLPVYSYHAPNSGKLFLQHASRDTVNQNPGLTQYTVRRWGSDLPERMLVGYTCNPEVDKATGQDVGFRWDNPGVTILPTDTGGKPLVFGVPGNARGRRGYYQIAPGSTVHLDLGLGKLTPGVEVTPFLRIATSDTTEHGVVKGQHVVLAEGATNLKDSFEVPRFDAADVYHDPRSELTVSCWVDLEFKNLTGPVEVKSLRLTIQPDSKASTAPALRVDGALHTAETNVSGKPGVTPLDLPPGRTDLSVVENASARPVNWLVQVSPVWQSRNAPVAQAGNTLRLGTRTNALTAGKEIVLAPLSLTAKPFVHKLSGICPAEVELFDEKTRRLAVLAKTVDGAGLIEIMAPGKAKKVSGAELVSEADGRLIAKMTQPGTAEFYF